MAVRYCTHCGTKMKSLGTKNFEGFDKNTGQAIYETETSYNCPYWECRNDQMIAAIFMTTSIFTLMICAASVIIGLSLLIICIVFTIVFITRYNKIPWRYK
jgi:hypothetical protein